MTTITLATLPEDVSTDMLVTYTWITAKNPSEGDIVGRKQMRTIVKRSYMLSIPPGPASLEFQKIQFAANGDYFPFQMRDWASYQMVDEELVLTVVGGATTAPLRAKFFPATGSLFYWQRVLCPDPSGLVFKLNDAALPGGVVATLIFPGIVSLNTVLDPDTDVVTVSGNYFVPVTCVDMPAATIKRGPGTDGKVLFGFQNIRLEELLENELIRQATIA